MNTEAEKQVSIKCTLILLLRYFEKIFQEDEPK